MPGWEESEVIVAGLGGSTAGWKVEELGSSTLCETISSPFSVILERSAPPEMLRWLLSTMDDQPKQKLLLRRKQLQSFYKVNKKGENWVGVDDGECSEWARWPVMDETRSGRVSSWLEWIRIDAQWGRGMTTTLQFGLGHFKDPRQEPTGRVAAC